MRSISPPHQRARFLSRECELTSYYKYLWCAYFSKRRWNALPPDFRVILHACKTPAQSPNTVYGECLPSAENACHPHFQFVCNCVLYSRPHALPISSSRTGLHSDTPQTWEFANALTGRNIKTGTIASRTSTFPLFPVSQTFLTCSTPANPVRRHRIANVSVYIIQSYGVRFSLGTAESLHRAGSP